VWIEIGKRLIPNAVCVLCGKESAKELAHMPRHKRNAPAKTHKWINVEENAVPIGFDCKEFSETHEGRLIAVAWLREKFGREQWDNWYDNLPFRIKEDYE
jgi:hypothetical protein